MAFLLLDKKNTMAKINLVGKGLSGSTFRLQVYLQGKSKQKLKEEDKQKSWRNATYWLAPQFGLRSFLHSLGGVVLPTVDWVLPP